jgi:hypothetical protein
MAVSEVTKNGIALHMNIFWQPHLKCKIKGSVPRFIAFLVLDER